MKISILYEDEGIVVINKPSGVMTHPDGYHTSETVSDWFARHYPRSARVGEPMRLASGEEIARPGIVHRLDIDTSGALVLAKTAQAHAFFKHAFQMRDVKKTYVALVYGVPQPPDGIINFPIGRSRKDFRLRSAQPKARGTLRDAVTHYEVVGDIGTHALVKAFPKTGRTHQIRVHFKAIHHPVVCDTLYAPNHPCDLGMNRLSLHAYVLDLPMLGGKRQEFIAPLPSDFAAAVAKFPSNEIFQAVPKNT